MVARSPKNGVWDYADGLIKVDTVGDVGSIERRPVKGDSIALLQHSSGTTSRKKGIALSHRAILSIEAYTGAL